ncbi:Serine/threonine protein phosphatase PrpC [Neorhodopirellula lusitana]|uniref:Serine/threonine protein phosphatase PrpC n=1 Tax=Neorhodopirellula lusitana TaxID=445327 RepID=A0ABY1QJW3_9BACT|nr:protein phosphatase 2C domain-containing protein [Neorhodopirellula lusitana]SMP73762.1 Serine/threonine protein phosphatase PrpC [Neorhodopirellula lusitana]
MKIAASALSDRGLKRDGNEDQYLIDESLGLYMVCDGMGGHAAGEVAAERAIEFTSKHISSHAQDLNSEVEKPGGYFRILKIAEEAVLAASQAVHRLSRSTPQYAGMGTTLTMLMIVDDKAIMAHVGDSRLYLMRAGEIHQLTVDHTLSNEMFLAGGLTKEQAAKSRYQHVLTRSIGPHESVNVDTLLFDLLPGDRLLLCSDGLSNYFTDSAIVAELLAKPHIVSQPHPLIDYAKDAGGADNITAVVVETLSESDAESMPGTEERMNFLRKSFLGRSLSVRRLLHLMTASATIHCNAGKELLAIDANCPGMYIVIEGSFRVIDDDIVESELVKGDCFGQATLIAPAKSPARLVANEASRVLLVDRRNFSRLTKRLPRLGNLLLRNLCRNLSETIVASETARPISLDDTGPLV